MLLQFKWAGRLNSFVPHVFFNFKSGQLMIYKSGFSMDLNGPLKFISNLLAFTGKKITSSIRIFEDQ